MNETINIIGICKMDGEIVPCQGYIEILGSDKYVVNVRWQMYMENGIPLVLKGISIYADGQNLTKEQIIEKAVASI